MEENRGEQETNSSNEREEVSRRESLLSIAQQVAQSVIRIASGESVTVPPTTWSIYDELDTPEGLSGKVLIGLLRDERYRGYLEFFAKTQDIDRNLSQSAMNEKTKSADEIIEWISSYATLLPAIGDANLMTFEIIHRYYNEEQRRAYIDAVYMAPRLESEEIEQWRQMRDAYFALVRQMVDFWHVRRFRDHLTFKPPTDGD